MLVFSARSITRPLRGAGRGGGGWLAQHRLPEAVAKAQAGHEEAAEPPPPVLVPPGASTEILSVAGALDQVQSTAYLLAIEQAMLRRSTAESLANLGRRNQNLLRRQLSFITRLEQEESDPQGLANLFELDHLATRMRRNAESLLVLVGEATPRRWAAPLPIADVIRAAISEVEEYRRVSLQRIDDGWVGGAYVAGIAHMIAELVENGLSFSPPDLEVEIQGRNLGGRYLIAVTDQGVGMDGAEIERANARLRGEESYLSVPTRFLGHYVVGHLAAQMGVEVEISPSPVTGITARVTLPTAVMAQPPALAAGGPGVAAATQHQSRAASAARANRAAAARVEQAEIVTDRADAGWSTGPSRALGTRPVVEYVPMNAVHETGSYGHATTALPVVEAGGRRYPDRDGEAWAGRPPAAAPPADAAAAPRAGDDRAAGGYQRRYGADNADEPAWTSTRPGGYDGPPAYAGQPAASARPDDGYPSHADHGATTQAYPTPAYPTEGYQTEGYPTEGYQTQSYQRDGYQTQSHQRQGYPAEGYPAESYPAQPGRPGEPVTAYADPPDAPRYPADAQPAGGAGYRAQDYPGAVPGVDRTANGLTKRVPRSRTAAPPSSRPAEQYAPMDSSPASVRSRLTSLREGMARGEGATRTHPDQHR